MYLQQRLNLLTRLGNYLLSDDLQWQTAKERAMHQNSWFTPEFIELAAQNIARHYLSEASLLAWTRPYALPAENTNPKRVGIVMAGNIPLVGFHDFLCVFVSGHQQLIKPSSKDDVLIRHLVQQLISWDASVAELVAFAERLNGCDAYIATGSNNSSRYFDYYFSKFPHIIRRNRTSVAVLTGNETMQDLEKLADDVYLYYGLGCRNVTKIYVPEAYDFVPLLEAFKKYNYLVDQHKFQHNYDYGLAILMLNQTYYMTNGSIILHANPAIFSPLAQLHYEYYTDVQSLLSSLKNNPDIQCIAGENGIPFGQAQSPALADYADGVDTLQFLLEL